MDDTAPTWIVLIRDLSERIQIKNQPDVFACMILDAETGLVRGMSVDATARKACGEAVRSALTKPAGPLPPGVPSTVYTDQSFRADVSRELRRLLAGATIPDVVPAPLPEEAEDIFDSFLGHMNGRQQPDEFPTPADWRVLMAEASAYSRAQPWLRWSDVDAMDLVITIDGAATSHTALVIGQEGIQRGLVLSPGPGMVDMPMPPWPGTVLLWLDPCGEVPADFAGRAERYGWPPDSELMPICLVGGPDGPGDLDRTAARLLTVTARAVTEHDRRGAAPGGPGTRTTGKLTLAGDVQSTYSVATYRG